jgi:hypothetical protein
MQGKARQCKARDGREWSEASEREREGRKRSNDKSGGKGVVHVVTLDTSEIQDLRSKFIVLQEKIEIT